MEIYLGGFALQILCFINPTSQNLIILLEKDPYPIVILSVFLDGIWKIFISFFGSVIKVDTMVTILPIGVVFVAREIVETKITPPKIISWIRGFFGCIFLLTYRYLKQLSGAGNSILGIYL